MVQCSEILVLVIASLVFVRCDITFGETKCGQKVCKKDEYCSPYLTLCDSCSKICDQSTHNFDRVLCVKNCQDYLHDSRYVLKEDYVGGGTDQNLRATVQRLSNLITVTLVLVCFILIALATVLTIQLYRWKKKKNITLATIKEKLCLKRSDPAPAKSLEKPDLRLEIPSESVHSGNSPVTVSTSISRKPAEDSTLDYAYDNPAMSSSPSKTSPTRF